MKHKFRAMQAHGGSIVHVSSPYPRGFPEATLYVGSKHAIIGVTKAAAIESAAHDIRVSVVVPGFTQTAMYERVPLQRLGRHEEVASVVVYLASGESAYNTAGEIFVDGGLNQFQA
jgi:NAD(P)-dependent dehydrogenase (short-subunit alcohol dehydrogenase family)